MLAYQISGQGVRRTIAFGGNVVKSAIVLLMVLLAIRSEYNNRWERGLVVLWRLYAVPAIRARKARLNAWLSQPDKDPETIQKELAQTRVWTSYLGTYW